MKRHEMLQRANELRADPWDMLIIGGGATGAGVAVDAASRGYEVLLLEGADFGKGTSSRSTKLVHGGVRYLRQGNIPLVMEALKERGILRRNAPHLVRDLAFVVPNYDWWEAPFYGIGMKVYDVLAGKYGFGPSHLLSREETIAQIPTIETEGLRGGVVYHDGQFDDARLLIDLVQTAVEQGATALNYARVVALTKGSGGFVSGARVQDMEGGGEFSVEARVVINATGVFSDEVRRLDDPTVRGMIRPSQGVHLVLDRSFLPGDAAIMVPHTDDGRVLFAVPWHDRVIVGTTDTPVRSISLEPRPFQEEVDFLLEHAARYLTKDPTPRDVCSVFAGLRPLVGSDSEDDTSVLSRDHTLHIAPSGLITIAGGKWTTYRKMAEDTVDHAITLAGLDPAPCITTELPIHGHDSDAQRFGRWDHYGSDAPLLEEMASAAPELNTPLHPRLPAREVEVVWAARHEMARTLEDVLSRRTRSLLLDARAAMEVAPRAAELMARELGHDQGWQDEQVGAFRALAKGYLAE